MRLLACAWVRLSARAESGLLWRGGVQIQFHARGPSGAHAVVNASMWQDSSKQWQYDLLFLDFGGPVQQRVYLVGPHH